MTTIAHPDPRRHAPAPAPASARPRVLFLLEQYPQAGQTHIASEIEALAADYEIGILALRPATCPYESHRPHRIATTLPEIIAAVEAFAPDILHAHHLTMLGTAGEVSRITGVPFTLRTHSADTLALRPRGIGARLRQWLRGEPPPARSPGFPASLAATESELCLGVLGFPFARPWLVRAGVCEAKLVDCFPVVRFDRFHDRSPNGDAVMSIGPGTGADAGFATGPAATADFLRLQRKVPGRSFNLYALAPASARQETGTGPAGSGDGVTLVPFVASGDMPREYKKHRWLVLTADADAPTRGWPMAIAEAQASGVGVCMPALRRDLAHYVGEGAGILYDSVDELPAIVSGPVPEEMRERGFEQARKSDIERHKHLLTDLWEDALRARAADHPAGAGFARAATLPAVTPPPSGLASADVASAA